VHYDHTKCIRRNFVSLVVFRRQLYSLDYSNSQVRSRNAKMPTPALDVLWNVTWKWRLSAAAGAISSLQQLWVATNNCITSDSENYRTFTCTECYHWSCSVHSEWTEWLYKDNRCWYCIILLISSNDYWLRENG